MCLCRHLRLLVRLRSNYGPCVVRYGGRDEGKPSEGEGAFRCGGTCESDAAAWRPILPLVHAERCRAPRASHTDARAVRAPADVVRFPKGKLPSCGVQRIGCEALPPRQDGGHEDDRLALEPHDAVPPRPSPEGVRGVLRGCVSRSSHVCMCVWWGVGMHAFNRSIRSSK